MRILHLPTPTGGNAWGLSQGERKIGMESYVLYREQSVFQYPADRVIFSKQDEEYYRKRTIQKNFRLFKEFLRILPQFDLFHYNFGSTLFEYSVGNVMLDELVSLRLTGKKIFTTFNGCDIRQRTVSLVRNQNSVCNLNYCNNICNEEPKRKKIKKFSRYSDHIFALNPDLLWYLPDDKSSFLPYTIASWYNIPDINRKEVNKKFTIVHSPTNRSIKGTDYLIGAIKELQSLYPDQIELNVIENVNNLDSLQMYINADLVVDQLLVGWYGAFAVEVMKMGKPVVAYIHQDDLDFIPKSMRNDLDSSVISLNPSNIFTGLEYYFLNKDELEKKGKNGKKFVEKWHEPKKIAMNLKKFYNF